MPSPICSRHPEGAVGAAADHSPRHVGRWRTAPRHLTLPLLLATATLAAACGEPAGTARATPFRPADDGYVILDLAASDAAALPAVSTAGVHVPEATTPQATADRARLALQAYAASGNPRSLGRAAALLAPWEQAQEVPVAIRLQRARLAQTRHAFAEAAAEADRLLAREPGHLQALLLAADAWRRRGNHVQARDRCARLALAGRVDLGQLCAADVLMAEGRTAQAQEVAARVVARHAAAMSPATRAWAHALHAQAAHANGALDIARAAWTTCLEATPMRVLAYEIDQSDTLLALGAHATVLDSLATLPPTDGVLLRLARAARALGDPRYAAWRDELAHRFESPAWALEADLHLRERALFALQLTGEHEEALALARRNWSVQKGWEDAHLLRAAARAAGAMDVERDLDRWLAGTGAGS